MSRAFVKESDGNEIEDLPELVVSSHRNLVTAAGLRQIEANLARLEAALSGARAAGDRPAAARVERDLRYWRQRRATAEVVPPAADAGAVRFGHRVTLESAAGDRLTYCIVGEDEADPRHGLISYLSPLAEALLGARPGDVVTLRDGEAEIIEIA